MLLKIIKYKNNEKKFKKLKNELDGSKLIDVKFCSNSIFINKLYFIGEANCTKLTGSGKI